MIKSKYFKRIDNLGRLVIPKKIRDELNINTGDCIEMSVNHKNHIILKKSKTYEYWIEASLNE